jgi:hypothetical protein
MDNFIIIQKKLKKTLTIMKLMLLFFTMGIGLQRVILNQLFYP